MDRMNDKDKEYMRLLKKSMEWDFFKYDRNFVNFRMEPCNHERLVVLIDFYYTPVFKCRGIYGEHEISFSFKWRSENGLLVEDFQIKPDIFTVMFNSRRNSITSVKHVCVVDGDVFFHIDADDVMDRSKLQDERIWLKNYWYNKISDYFNSIKHTFKGLEPLYYEDIFQYINPKRINND